jgi:3-mercaptopyruvate sulfurtransferase SseA
MADCDDVLVSTEWPVANLDARDQRIVDCSWYLPVLGRDARAEFLRQHVPGAVRFDIDDIAQHGGLGAHMLPPADVFARTVGRVGIDNRTRVVVYDTNYVSARVWWRFRVFGHDNVVMLDDGLTKWLAEGRPVEAGEVAVAPATFVARTHLRRQSVLGVGDVPARSSARACLPAPPPAGSVNRRTARRWRPSCACRQPGMSAASVSASTAASWPSASGWGRSSNPDLATTSRRSE